MAQLAEEAFVDGIPRFPEQYLYDHYQPVLAKFEWAGPLELENAFFDRFRLCDTSGTCYEVSGEAVARGLWLASRSGPGETRFPVDPQIAESILHRYLGELKLRRQALVKLAHQSSADQKMAERLIKQVWRNSGLPAWEAVEEVDAFLSGNFFVK